jgi:hypothetical protein
MTNFNFHMWDFLSLILFAVQDHNLKLNCIYPISTWSCVLLMSSNTDAKFSKLLVLHCFIQYVHVRVFDKYFIYSKL